MNKKTEQRLLEIKLAIDKIKHILTTRRDTLSADAIEDLKEKAVVLAREYRVLRSEHDLLYFMYEYFSDERNPDNENNLIPAGTLITDAPDFHHELCDALNELNTNPIKRICWSVPRGHAKSAYLSNAFPIHQIVFKKRRYIIIISETEAIAKKFVEFVADQLKFNEKLRADFGELLAKEKQANEMDNQEGFITANDIKVQAASTGKQLRGARHKNARPDLVICDDCESSKNTNTKELRDKNLNWFNSVVVPMGDPEKTGFIYMGTMVHGDGLLPAVLRRSDFQGAIYSAITSEPVRGDLWKEYEDILRDIDNPNRAEEAETFYLENKDAMDEGAKTLWSSRFPYKELISIKINVGSKAFASEYLNQASDSDSCVFNKDHFVFYNEHELAMSRYKNLDIYAFWDIALGKSASKGDYNAIITIGRDRTTGVIYVLDAFVERIPMHKALRVALQKVRQWRPKIIGVESVQAQYDQFRQLRELCIKEGLYSTRVLAVHPRGRKEDRIETLEPLIEAGVIRFNKGHRLLLEQLELFGGGATHDDAPDALQQAIEIAGKQRRRTHYKKPQGM